jgi:hypothetical protein
MSRTRSAGCRRMAPSRVAGLPSVQRSVGLEGDLERIGNVLRKIVHGLYYLERGRTVMPFDVDWNYLHESPLTGRPPDFVMEMFHGLPLRSVGDVVRYKFTFPRGTARDRLVAGVLRTNHVHGVDWAEGPLRTRSADLIRRGR